MSVLPRFLPCGLLAAAVGIGPALGQEPAPLKVVPAQSVAAQDVPTNQRIADAIATRLRQSGLLHHYTVNINYTNGIADLTGSVTEQTQREEVIRLTQGVPGVERVLDHLALSGSTAITQVQAGVQPAPLRDPTLAPPRAPEVAGNGPVEPMPIFSAPPPTPYDVNAPKMPPYAWPTYAPYNNYSRVATPLAYPYNSWPYIGPVYPFPKVPLGWRSVKLQWEDGHWWFSKVGCQHDWWRLRYW